MKFSIKSQSSRYTLAVAFPAFVVGNATAEAQPSLHIN